jgi:prophage regulatory protein
MKLLSKRALREIVLYSPQHIARLEKAGHFPKRVRLGEGRVGWIEQEPLKAGGKPPAFFASKG